MRLAVLWEQWTGYLDECVRNLLARTGGRVLRSCIRPVPEAPFCFERFVPVDDEYLFDHAPDYRALSAKLLAFEPDLILVASWSRPAYRRTLLDYKGRATRVVHIDNQWRGSLKQYAGMLTSPIFVRRFFDRAFVAGERQRHFARKIGFEDREIAAPSLSSNPAALPYDSLKPLRDRKRFIFVGRLVHAKGIADLTSAYRHYRDAAASEAWDLAMVGGGALKSEIVGTGISYHGFLEGAALWQAYNDASAFILASHFEPWGVVLHEAAGLGLPIICTMACGAGDAFVDHERNGLIVPTGDRQALAQAMMRVTALSDEELQAWGQRSRELSLTITPDHWTDALMALGEI